MITLDQYWMGRDKAYAEDFTLAIARNAGVLLARVNILLSHALADGVEPALPNPVASGWRPPSVNDKTSNAARKSTHLTGHGIDLRDHGDRRLARWALRNLDKLETIGVWMEDPRWTPSWVHWQSVPPGSGRRVFVPSLAPALALALPEQVVRS